MNDSGVKIELHLIQNFAPSNLNRDDTGQPKSAYFGGYRRARISSQCGKRAAREWWRQSGTVAVGDRTKRLQQLIGDKLAQDKEFTEMLPDEEDRKAGIRLFTEAYYAASDKKKLEKTSVLIFIAPDEVDACARAIKDIWHDQNNGNAQGIGSIIKKVREFDAKNPSRKTTPDNDNDMEDGAGPVESDVTADGDPSEQVGRTKNDKRPKLKPIDGIKDRLQAAQVSADIALFGRMLAEQPGRNTDGACQVAHPISTHKVDMEMDFYTAVDDLNPAEETGAGMMGTVGFNSACYYRYALVDRDQLARNLARKTTRKDGNWADELTARDYAEADVVIKAFLEAMVYAIPTGKQNSFAAQTLPSFGLFVRRRGGVPISLANAFARPVRHTKDDDDLVGRSVEALTRHWDALQRVYGDQGKLVTACFHLEQEGRLNGLGDSDKGSVDQAIQAMVEEAKQP